MTRFPSLFVSHGSPMMALEDSRARRFLCELGAKIGKPDAILVASAHWEAPQLAFTTAEMLPTIHDFGGFPQALHDLMHTYNRLKNEHGILPEFCVNHGPTTSMYYFDPDKNQIELQVDNVPEDSFAEYFDNGEFTDNPIGITFDPDELTAKLAAGVPEAELLKRPDGTPPDLSEFPVN